MIRKLPRYVLTELLSAFVLAIVIIQLLLLAGLSVKLVYRGLSVDQLARLAPYLMLLALPHALPAALLTASVMTFGRLSGDNEITAVRSTGVHLYVVVLPAVLVGLAASLIGLWLNFQVLPWAYFRVDQLKLSAAQALAQSFIKARGEMTIPPYQIRAEDVQGSKLINVTVLEYDTERVRQIWSAKEAEIKNDPKTNILSVCLRNGQLRQLASEQGGRTQTIEFSEIYFPVQTADLNLKEPREFKHMPMRLLLRKRAERLDALAKCTEFYANPRKARKKIHKEVSRLDQERNTWMARADDVSAEIKRIDAEIQAGDTLKRNAKALAAEQLEKINTLNVLIAKARRDLKALGRQLSADAQRRRVELKKRIRQYEREIEQANMRKDEARKGARDVDRKRGRLLKRRRELQAKLAEYGEKIRAISAKRDQVAKRLHAARAQLDMIEIKKEIHQRAAVAFSCLVFVLIGVPLGLLVRRGNVLVGFAVSFMVVLLVYYPLLLGGRVLIFDKHFPVAPCVWTPDVVVAVIGLALLWRVFRE